MDDKTREAFARALREKNPSVAREILMQVLTGGEQLSSQELGHVLFHLGAVLSRLPGQGDSAEQAFSEAVARNPDMVEAHHNLGVLAHGREDHQEALAAFQRGLLRAPRRSQLLRGAANAAFALGAHEVSRAVLEALWAAGDRSASVAADLARTLLVVGEHDRGFELMLRAATMGSPDERNAVASFLTPLGGVVAEVMAPERQPERFPLEADHAPYLVVQAGDQVIRVVPLARAQGTDNLCVLQQVNQVWRVFSRGAPARPLPMEEPVELVEGIFMALRGVSGAVAR
jgi:tetratricopeptide (TPR) repeat protein